MELGEEIGRGLRSVVYAYGSDVAKSPNDDVPVEWLVEEYRLSNVVARAGARLPGRRRMVGDGDHMLLVAERIDGPSMWERLVAEPASAADLGTRLAHVQTDIARCTPSFELPAQRDRMMSKIHLAAARHGSELARAVTVVPPDEGPLVLCHGDLHPQNVLLARGGEVLIDWLDASRGSILGEIARTLIVIDDSHELDRRERTGLAPVIAALRTSYEATACELAGATPSELEPWVLAQGVARLAEGLGLHRLDMLRRRLTPAGVTT